MSCARHQGQFSYFESNFVQLDGDKPSIVLIKVKTNLCNLLERFLMTIDGHPFTVSKVSAAPICDKAQK